MDATPRTPRTYARRKLPPTSYKKRTSKQRRADVDRLPDVRRLPALKRSDTYRDLNVPVAKRKKHDTATTSDPVECPPDPGVVSSDSSVDVVDAPVAVHTQSADTGVVSPVDSSTGVHGAADAVPGVADPEAVAAVHDVDSDATVLDDDDDVDSDATVLDVDVDSDATVLDVDDDDDPRLAQFEH